MADKILNGRALPPVLSAILLVVFLVLSLAALLRLNVNNAPEVYLPKSAPSVLLDKELRKNFPGDQVLIALFKGDVYSDRFLSGLASTVERLKKQPLVQRVMSVFTMDHVAGSEDGFSVEPLLDPKGFETLSVAQRKKRVLGDRFAPGMLAAQDGSALALILRPVHLTQSGQRKQIEAELMHAVKETGIRRDMVAVGGEVPMETAEFQSMVRDTVIFVPIEFVIALSLLGVMFRRGIAVLFGGLAMAVVTVGTVAIIAISGKPYTLITAMLPPLMAALTAALLIHLLNSITLASHRGLCGQERVAWACRNIERPARFTVFTTAAGLASLSLSPIPPIQSFGLTAAAGMVLVYVVCILLLPPLFGRWDKSTWNNPGIGLRWANKTVEILAGIGIRHAGVVVVATVLIMVATLPMLRWIKVETDMFKFFPEDHPISKSSRLIEKTLSGVTPLEVDFKGAGRDSLKNAARLAQLKAVQNHIESLPEVDRTLSMMDIIEEMNWAFHGENPTFRRIPANSNLISQYLLIYDGHDLYDLVDREFQQTRLLLSLNVHGSNEINAVIGKINKILRTSPPDGLQYHIAGFGRLFTDQVDLLMKGQIRSLWGALILIFTLLVVIWRSVKDSILTMIPNVAPVLIMFVVMGAMGIWLDMATAMIASVAVGIAVDDTIHLFHIYRSRRQAGSGAVMALGRAYHDAGRAVVITTLILCAQFLVLTASQFRPTVEFGFLTTLGLASALLFDLLLLPAILILINQWRGRFD